MRVIAELPLTWARLHRDGSVGPQYTSTTTNVSVGGVGLITSEPVWEGERMRLEVKLGDPPVAVRGNATVIAVTHPRPNRWACNMRFDDLDPRLDSQLTKWVFTEERRVADRRAHARIPLQVIVTCRPLDELGTPIPDAAFKAFTVDVAADGLRMETERDLPEGERMHFQLSIGNPPQSLAVAGRIVWSKPTQPGWKAYGVHFEDLDEHMHRVITERAYAQERGQRRPS
jgi:Tfp pilus assembly protein PilZ